MENNNENQKSTEQLYASIEESSIELEKNVEEEVSYSLEDLHPEETIKEVAPAASHEEEVQPDPTVIDGKRETIGDQSSIMEASPVVQQPVMNQPLQQPQAPVQMVIPKPVPEPIPQIKKQQPQKQIPEEPNAKIFYAIFAIILVVVLVGLPLYTSIQNTLDSKSGTSEPITEEPKTNEEEANTPPSQSETKPPQIQQIDFNMNLEFDKGFVINEKEINQRTGYLPTNLNGVIRCDLENPTNIEGITTYASTYLHYENFKLRSAITVTKQVYNDTALYMNNKDATLIYKTAGDKEETLDVEIKQDDTNRTITNIMQYHLMYGHTTPVEGLETPYIQFTSPYNTNIKTAIDTITKSGSNIVCGTINTENATS